MSKISDALDKANKEREKNQEGHGPAGHDSELGQSLSGHLPSGMWREFGIMRNLVESHLPSRTFRSIVVTSATLGEGVSTVTANFAKVLADDPLLNVLVVDANPQHAAQHELFGLDSTRGFVELARGDSKPEEVIKSTSRRNLSVIPSGIAVGGMFQLVGVERVTSFMEALQPRFHYLFFDAPPVLSYPETAILGSHVDGVLLVVRAVSTRREVVARARDALAVAGCNIVGVVLNRFKYSIPEFIYRRV